MLRQLVQEHGADMNPIHVSALFTRAKALCCHKLQQPVVQQLLQELERLAERVQQQCEARALASIMWACGHLQLPRTVELLLPRLLQPQQLQQANPHDVADTLGAVNKLGQQLQPGQLMQLVAAFLDKLSDANPQDISMFTAAVAKLMQQQHKQLPDKHLAALEAAFSDVLPQANAQAVANTLWACAKQQDYPQQLLAGLRGQGQSWLLRMLSGAPLIDIAGIANACAQLGCQDAELLSTLLQQALSSTQQDARGLTNLCWSAAVLDLRQSTAHVQQLAAGCSTLWSSMVAEDKQQLWQVHLWLRDSTTTQPQGLSDVLTAAQLQECQRESEQVLERDTQQDKVSQLQQRVFAAVRRLPPNTWQQQPVMEQRTSDRAFSIDIATVTARGGKQLAIEVDGPSHFLRADNRLDGPTQARDRALAARGWEVVSLPYFELRELRSEKQLVAYLRRKLHGVL